MKKKLKFGETFCVLPWIEQHYDLQGRQRFCCYSDHSVDDNAENLRQEIWSGKKIPHCENCYKLEESKTISPRQIESSRWLQDSEIQKYFESEFSPDEKIVFYDLRYQTKCNLACISCNEHNSSLWAKELKIPIKITKKNYTKKIDFSSVKKIYMAGGEPLLIQDYIDLLTIVSEKNPKIEIIVNTNLSCLPKKFLNVLDQLENISFVVSVDAYGKVNEYHRYPITWDKFYNNLMTITDSKVKIQFNTVVDAVSIFGLGNLNKLQHIPITWHLSILQHPNWLLLRNIPQHFKNKALENVKEFSNNNFAHKDLALLSKLELIKNELQQQGNTNLLLNEITKLDSRRNIRHSDYLDFDFRC